MASSPNNSSNAWLRTVTGTIAVTGLTFLSSAITARVLGPEGRGVLGAALLCATVAAGLCQFGLAQSLVFFRGSLSPDKLRTYFLGSALGIAVIAVPLVSLMLGVTRSDWRPVEVWMVGFLGCSTALYTFSTNSAMLESSLKLFNRARVLFPTGVAIFAAYAWLSDTHSEPIAFMAAQSLVASLVTIYCLFTIFKSIDRRHPNNGSMPVSFRSFISYGIKSHGTVVISLFLLNIDKFFLLKVGSLSQFGIYSLAYATTRVMSTVQDAASTAIYSRYAGGNTQNIRDAVARTYRLTFVPMLMAALLVAMLAPTFVPLVFGRSYEGMIWPIAILTFEAVIGAASWTLAQRFYADGRPGMVFGRQLIVMVVFIGALFVIPADRAVDLLPWLLLLAASARLVLTMTMYRLFLNEPFPRTTPTKSEIGDLFAAIKSKFTRA